MCHAFVLRSLHVRLIFSYSVRPLHAANCVHTGTRFFKRPYSYTLHWSASSSMKETLGRLISKTTTKTKPRTRWYRSQLPAHRQNEPRFSHEENAEHSQEQMSFQRMSAACSTGISHVFSSSLFCHYRIFYRISFCRSR